MKRSSTPPVVGLVAVTCIVVAGALAPNRPADAATITAAYAVGHRDVTINGYGARGLGAFVLRAEGDDPDAGSEHTAFCIEAHTSHSTTPDRYRRVANQVTSPQLDYLLWKYGVPGTAEHTPLDGDHDTATAVAALAWYYAGASRRGGGAVWSNPSTGSAIGPTEPHPWHELPAYSARFPVGLRSGSVHLDAAERRVHELYLEAEARRGPWTMSPVAYSGRRADVTVSGPAGPIAGVGGVRFEVRDRAGAILANTVAATDGSGTAAVEVPELPAGGSIAVSMFAPGVHDEWDGDGDVQRLSTGTTDRLDRRRQVEPSPMFLHVAKRSSDPTFSPSGARFALVDADGDTVASATTDDDGTASFPPLAHGAHPTPLSIRELEAPPGLQVSGVDVVVPDPISLDRSRPTVVEIVNHPVERSLLVRKELSDPRVGPSDRSGFEFEVTRTADGRSFGTIVTDADGRAGPTRATVGSFEVCERRRPGWAAGLEDPGCHTVDLTGDDAATVEVVYTNVVPPPSIGTRVYTAIEGDQVLPATGGVLTDVVTHHDLVPGTEYRLDGSIQVIGHDGSAPSGLAASTTFTPETPTGEVEVVFDVPAGAGIATGVVYQQLLIGDDVVATHADPDDAAQTFWVPTIDTAAYLTDDGLVDEVRYRGLPPGDYQARVEWHRRLGDGTCEPTDLVAAAPFTVAGMHEGVVVVGPAPLEPGERQEIEGMAVGGVAMVAFQTVVAADTRRTLAVHHDCDADVQTVEIPPAAVRPTTVAPTTVSPTTVSPTTVSPTPTVPESPITASSWPRPTTTLPPAPARRSLPSTGTPTVPVSAALGLMALGAGVLGVLAGVRDRRIGSRR